MAIHEYPDKGFIYNEYVRKVAVFGFFTKWWVKFFGIKTRQGCYFYNDKYYITETFEEKESQMTYQCRITP